MITRYVAGCSLGAVAALALLYLMHWLISSDEPRLSEPPDVSITEFIRVIDEPTLDPTRPRTEPPPPPEPPPSERVVPEFASETPGPLGIEFTEPAREPHNVGPPGRTDGDLLPIVRVEPVYPRQALERGIEGYVIVEFTVNTLGAVENPVVVEANPPRTFDRAAIQAALRFRYQPRIVGGQPVAVSGVRTQLTFSLDQ